MFFKNIYYEQYGEGETILFIHGWMHDHTTYYQILDNLKLNHKIILIDLPGFGNSTVENTEGNLLNYLTESVYNFITEQKLTLNTIIGHSMGGIISLKMLKEFNLTVDNLIILDSPYDKIPIFFKTVSKMKAITQFLINFQKKYPLPKRKKFIHLGTRLTIKDLSVLDDNFYNALYKANPVVASKLFYELGKHSVILDFKPNVKKSLVVRGEGDLIATKKVLQKLADFLNCKLVEIKNISHTPTLEAPKELEKIIIDFLERK